MDYEAMDKKALIEKMNEKDRMIDQMRQELIQQGQLNLPWAGNLGQWHWRPQDNKVVYNEKKATALGYSPEELPDEVGYEFFTSKLHPDDYEGVMANMMAHLKGETEAYEVEYRIKKKDGGYKWYYDRGVVVSRNDLGQPLLITGIVFDITQQHVLRMELMDKNRQLENLVKQDYLTGIYNRRYFSEVIEKEIMQSRRTAVPLCLAMCDIDNFKEINDRFGHDVGDKVIVATSRLLEKRLRSTDVLARWGGEEFIILLTDATLDGSYELVEDLRSSIQKGMMIDGITITVSFGLIELDPFRSISDQIAEVDGFMYSAKEQGKNRTVIEAGGVNNPINDRE